MTREDLIFRTGFTRFLLGTMALCVFPVIHPGMRRFIWVYVGYLALAAVEQFLIRKKVGGHLRSLLFGVIDMAFLTFLVHRLGSVSTVMASVYFVSGVLNALVINFRVGAVLAGMNATAYAAVVWAEWAGMLPFAPDVPDLQVLGAPTTQQAAVATTLVTFLILLSAIVVGLLVQTIDKREAALVEANRRLADLSQRDALTNLFNRRHLYERLEHELHRVARGHALAVLMIDLDGFKRVNDTEGHLTGDQVLREIAAAILTITRASDIVGRYGGDEFVLLLPDTDETQAQVVAERVTDSVREAGLRSSVTASVGIAVAAVGDAALPLLRRADENAYFAKRAGGNSVSYQKSIRPAMPSDPAG